MARIKFTKHAIERIKAPAPSGKQTLYWDTELRGFGLLVSGIKDGKTYVVQRQIKGKTRRVTVGPTNVFTLEKARSRAQELLAEFYVGIDPKEKRRSERQAGITLQQLLDEYCTARKNLAANTIAEYKSCLKRYLADWLNRPIRTITPDMVESRHKEIQQEVMKGVYSKRKNLNSNASGYHAANGAMRYLRILWNFAGETMNDLPSNPVLRLRRRWYPEKPREGIIKPLEIEPFYKAALQLTNRVQGDYLIFVLFTGLRRREAASLLWTDIDFQGRVIRIPAARTKAKRTLDLPMTDVVYDLLQSRLAPGKDGDHVFPANSKSGHIAEPRVALDEIAEQTKIDVTVHDLRRTYITTAESCDLPIYALKALVNHALPRDVTAGYVMMNVDRLRLPAQKVADTLKKLAGINPPVVVPFKQRKRG